MAHKHSYNQDEENSMRSPSLQNMQNSLSGREVRTTVDYMYPYVGSSRKFNFRESWDEISRDLDNQEMDFDDCSSVSPPLDSNRSFDLPMIIRRKTAEVSITPSKIPPDQHTKAISNPNEEGDARLFNSEAPTKNTWEQEVNKTAKVFACPYSKYDPIRYSQNNTKELEYRLCVGVLFRDIPRLKQHLKRVHDRPLHYCLRCYKSFESPQGLHHHSRQINGCVPRTCPYPEKLNEDQKEKIYVKRPGRDPEKIWYDIYAIIFPGTAPPKSPYTNFDIETNVYLDRPLQRSQKSIYTDMEAEKIIPRGAFSDSGYHSGIGTDTDSVCSMGSVGSSLGLPPDFLQDFVAVLGDALIARAGAHVWAGSVTHRYTPDAIELCLNTLLKNYVTELLESMDDPSNRRLKTDQATKRIADGAVRLIRRYRPTLAQYVRENAVSSPENSMSANLRLQQLGKQLSLAEKVALLQRKPTDARKGDERSWKGRTGEFDQEEEDEELLGFISPIRDFLISGEAFRNLAVAMKRSLYYDERSNMEWITEKVLPALHDTASLGAHPLTNAEFFNTKFIVTWNVESFLLSQYGRNVPKIGSLVALTGSALYAQATTCEEYIKTHWPDSGMFFLSALQSVYECSDRFEADGNNSMTYASSNLHLVIADFDKTGSPAIFDDIFSVSATGTKKMVVELVQLIAWLGAVLRSSPFQENLAYCKAIVHSHDTGTPFDITFRCEPLHPSEKVCWLPLFDGACIARDFPISERQEEMGLEIPLQIMAGIAGVRHAVEFEGGLVMKGYSSMFVPVKRNDDRVQWHLVSSDNCEKRLSYRDGLKHCGQRALLEEVDIDCLPITRAIVGWCSFFSCFLGSQAITHENLHYSGAADTDRNVKFAGGTFGFQQFGLAQLDFTLGPKDGRCHFQRSGPYRRIISAAEKTPIVLYDRGEQRAWLVNATDVILHLAHHRHWQDPFELDGKEIMLPTTTEGKTTKDILLQNASVNLAVDERYTFKDMILNIWSILEFLIDQNVRYDRTPGVTLKGTLRPSLQGFEFKAVAEERSPYQMKETILEKSCGGWPTLVRDIDALILFGDGFNDLIKPRFDEVSMQMCHRWRTMPKGNDYLATSVKMINELYEVAGSRLDKTYLSSSHLRWHQGSAILFEPCKTPGVYRCACSRVQQIVPKSALGHVHTPCKLHENGAIIFGQSESAFQDLIAGPVDDIKASIYSQPNACLNVESPLFDMKDDSQLRTTAEFEMAPHSDSDATDTTMESCTMTTSHQSISTGITELTLDSELNQMGPKRVLESDEASCADHYCEHGKNCACVTRKRLKSSMSSTSSDSTSSVSCETLRANNTGKPANVVNNHESVLDTWFSHKTLEPSR